MVGAPPLSSMSSTARPPALPPLGGSVGGASHGDRLHDGGFGKSRLPRIQPNINKRAQQIIAAHMRCESATTSLISSNATVPVLTQIDSTAPQTAKTHDISHLCDEGPYLRPRIPASKIEELDHVYETSFLPKDSSSTYSDTDGLWHTKLFPSHAPSSRQDAVLLDAWITRSLERYVAEDTGSKEAIARAVEDLVPILSVALHEIVRQVTHHCTERGLVLEKIWMTYVELFDRVLRQMQASLCLQKERTAEVTDVLAEAKEDLNRLRKEHPEKMHAIIADLEAQFTSRQQQYEDSLEQADRANQMFKEELRSHHQELELWYPGFPHYQDSYLKTHMPQVIRKRAVSLKGRRSRSTDSMEKSDESVKSAGSEQGENDADIKQDEALAPEVAIAEDFKRVLSILAPEKRKLIGRDLAHLLDPRLRSSSELGEAPPKANPARTSTVENEAEEQRDRIEGMVALREEIGEQDYELKRLRREICAIEQSLQGHN